MFFSSSSSSSSSFSKQGTNPQEQLPTNTILLASSTSSTILSIIALALQAALNHQSPQRDTLQTWTCMWKNVQGEGVPQSFDTLCHETVSSTLVTFTSQNQKRKEKKNHFSKITTIKKLTFFFFLIFYSALHFTRRFQAFSSSSVFSRWLVML